MDDQDKAIRFYTGVLGFVKKTDISAGNYRWLTVVSAEEPDGPQLLLEPNENPAAKSYQESIFSQGIPAAMFFVDDLQKEMPQTPEPWREIHHGADEDTRLDYCHLR